MGGCYTNTHIVPMCVCVCVCVCVGVCGCVCVGVCVCVCVCVSLVCSNASCCGELDKHRVINHSFATIYCTHGYRDFKVLIFQAQSSIRKDCHKEHEEHIGR